MKQPVTLVCFNKVEKKMWNSFINYCRFLCFFLHLSVLIVFFFINKQDKKCQLIFICVKTKTFVDEMTHETGNMYSIHIIDRVFHYDTQWSVCGYVCVCGVHFVFVQFHLQPSR